MDKLELEEKRTIIECIKNNDLYDYICSNYYRIENDILLELLLECIATLEERQNDKLIDNLIEFKEWDV